ncbi:LPP20 family lipoprotein [Cyclobacteriaceae bacterium]|nr:LPP20 family lipoprotein [Cyclobacteriaceae bacterium]
MKPLVFSALFLLILFPQCKSSKPVAVVEEPTNPKPEWLTNRPVNHEYYIGISGSSKLKERFEYATTAKARALEDLASGIKIKVESNSVLYQLERNSDFKDSYESVVRSKTSQNLEGYELVDSWENDEEYWVYYRLSRKKYADQEAAKKTNAQQKALLLFEKGLQAEQAMNLVTAVKLYFQSLKALESYLGSKNEVTHQGKQIDLVSELYNSVQTIFSKTKIEASDLLVHTRGVTKNQKIAVKTFYESKQTGIPLQIRFNVGKGKFSSDKLSNTHGSVSFNLEKVLSFDMTQEITIEVDLSTLGDDMLTKAFLSNITLPTHVVELTVNKPTIYISSTENAFGNSQSSHVLADEFSKQLINHGFSLSMDKKRADLLVVISADTKKGSENSGIFITYLTAQFKVTNRRSSIMVYSQSLVDIKGAQLDYDKSSEDAYSKALKPLDKKILPEIHQVLFE